MASFCGLRTTRDQFVGVLVATVIAFVPTSFTLAADEAIFAPGEPVITGFSGVVPPATPPASGKALDYTFIDPAGSSMVIQQLQPDGPPTGQLIAAKPVFSASAADVGQTFGVALDDAPEFSGAAAPNIYLAATSAFGLNIVVPDADGKPVRSKHGAPGATFMPGQWGSAGGVEGYPGSIWKVDGSTGEISLFTTIAANSGAGLGNLVYDPASAQFFVSDLDTGLIYRLAADGIIIDTFDHGVTGRPTHGLAPVADDGSEMAVTDPAFNSEDPQTWGFTQPERKVYGLAVNGGRLFYAVAQAVWSVRINADGSFGAARWELDITGLPSNSEVASIAFDPQGRMILAQRGPQAGSYDYSVFAEARRSSVVRYAREFPDDPANARHLDRDTRQLRHRHGAGRSRRRRRHCPWPRFRHGDGDVQRRLRCLSVVDRRCAARRWQCRRATRGTDPGAWPARQLPRPGAAAERSADALILRRLRRQYRRRSGRRPRAMSARWRSGSAARTRRRATCCRRCCRRPVTCRPASGRRMRKPASREPMAT
jgi:hypothetical protein